MGQATTVDMDGVRVIQGTPSRALTGPTLFLNMWKVTKPAEPVPAWVIMDRGKPPSADDPSGETVDVRRRHEEEEKIFKSWLAQQRRI